MKPKHEVIFYLHPDRTDYLKKELEGWCESLTVKQSNGLDEIQVEYTDKQAPYIMINMFQAGVGYGINAYYNQITKK
ncbi:MAG TPA: hypothetical protein V6C58_03370 [Allocoleopsis sp.]